MPTIIGSKSGTRPHLELDWSVNRQDIANNRSSVNLKLYLRVNYSIGYSARYTGTLQGASFTSSSGYISSPGRYLLTQRDVWIGHNSNGSKTARLTADYNLNITWGGVYHGKISLSGDANLGTIPRASTLSAFSFGAHLKNGVANSIKYTVDRKSGSFRHQIQLRDGSTTIWTWDNQNTNGSNSITLTASNVNTLLNRIKNSTTKSFTLRVATRSGSGGSWIGSAVSRNATATVHKDVKPSVGAVSLSQTGNSVSSHYLQGKSKVKASFTRSAGYGASISSSSIQVRRVSGGADSQTINSNDGTTNNPVSLSGSYQARGIATDSRGRFTHTAWATFTVTAYSAPRITNFTAVRSSSAETTVVVTRNGTHTSLGNANSARMLIQKRTGTGSWTTVEDKNATSGSWGGSVNSTGNSTTSSYDFRATLTDAFGESATANVTVSTQRVVLDIHKNEGVGIGKIHENGVLDVDGSAYFDGDLYVNGVNQSRLQSFSQVVNELGLQVSDSISFWQTLPQGRYFVAGSGSIPNQPNSYGIMDHVTQSFGSGSDYNTIWYSQAGGAIYRKSGNGNTNYAWRLIDRPQRGSNSNGHWVRFEDGTQICWHRWTSTNTSSHSDGNGMWRSGHISKTHAKSFTSTPSVSMTAVGDWRTWMGPDSVSTTSCNGVLWRAGGSISSRQIIDYMAVGRWK